MKWTPEYVRYVQRIAYETDALSLNMIVSSNNETSEDMELGAVVADPVDITELVESKIKRDELKKLIDQLKDPREIYVLRLRFGFIDGEPKTLEEIGAKFGVTRERIRQLETKSLRKLRELVKKKGLTYEDFK